MDQIRARPASTIVVIREHDAVLEILMLRRSPEVAAASGAHVFPGGGVDEVDHDVVRRGLLYGLDEPSASRRLGLESGALAFYCAALRELFEEAGLLIARDARGRPASWSTTQLDQWRAHLVESPATWTDLLASNDVRLDVGATQYLAHWVTPEGRRRRFDTRFFVARAPQGQLARADDSEIDQVQWSRPVDALGFEQRGEWTMLPPTVHTLRHLLDARSVDEVMASAANSVVQRIQPREIERDGRLVVVVPDDPGFD